MQDLHASRMLLRNPSLKRLKIKEWVAGYCGGLADHGSFELLHQTPGFHSRHHAEAQGLVLLGIP